MSFGLAFGEHVLHGEAASSDRECVPAAVGLRTSAGQVASGPRQHYHLYLNQGGLSRRLSQRGTLLEFTVKPNR